MKAGINLKAPLSEREVLDFEDSRELRSSSGRDNSTIWKRIRELWSRSQHSLCTWTWGKKIQSLSSLRYRLPTLPDALYFFYRQTSCGYVSIHLSLSLRMSLRVYVRAYFVYRFNILSNIYIRQPRSAADPRDICPGLVRDALFPARESPTVGVINHRPLCFVERGNIVPGGTSHVEDIPFFPSFFHGRPQLTLSSCLYY